MTAGMRFPFEISGEHGRVRESSAEENIRESVKIILTTEPGERVMNPKFGTCLRQFLFEPVDSRTKDLIAREVIHSLSLWEDRIEQITVNIEEKNSHEGAISVDVRYRIVRGEEDGVTISLGY